MKTKTNRKEEISKELEEWTFRPTVVNYSEQAGLVYEKIHYKEVKEKEVMHQKTRDNNEMSEFTFKPKINPQKYYSSDSSFEKFYKDAEVKREKIRHKELSEKDKDIVDCTFRPVIKNVLLEGTGNVYEKLYNNFQEIQKERRRKLLENQVKEVAEVQLIPRLVTPKQYYSEIPVYTRLYAEVEKRKEKMRRQVEERDRERSTSATRMKKTDEPPRFEHLYALHKDKKEKQVALEERYMKEAGIIFKPNISKKDANKVLKQYSPKGPYPMPKNPQSDISWQSFHTSKF